MILFEQLENIRQNIRFIQPEIAFSGIFLFVILLLSFGKKANDHRLAQFLNWFLLLVLLGMCLAYYQSYDFYHESKDTGNQIFGEMIYVDLQSIFIKFIIALSAIFVLLHISIVGYRIPVEFYPIFIGMLIGLFFLTMTTNLLMLYIAIEIVSISSYILTAFNKSKANSEAGIKYLLYGACASAIMLYGISFLYGMTGTLNFASQPFTMNLFLNPSWVVLSTCFMTLGALFFKISAAPFQGWTPDVYEATPTPIVAFFSIAPKAAALLALIRFTSVLSINYQSILALVVLASLTIGNFSALWQTNAKRMLAYSTIAHAGFMLVGILASTELGVKSTIFYISTYLFITLGAFFLIDLLALKTESYQIDKLKGLGRTNLLLGISAIIIMIALAGLPPSIGFTAKFMVFSALWESYQTTGNKLQLIVLVFGLLNVAVSIFYYMKIPYYLIIKESENKGKPIILSFLQKAFLLVLCFFILYLFFNPSWLMQVINTL